MMNGCLISTGVVRFSAPLLSSLGREKIALALAPRASRPFFSILLRNCEENSGMREFPAVMSYLLSNRTPAGLYALRIVLLAEQTFPI